MQGKQFPPMGARFFSVDDYLAKARLLTKYLKVDGIPVIAPKQVDQRCGINRTLELKDGSVGKTDRKMITNVTQATDRVLGVVS